MIKRDGTLSTIFKISKTEVRLPITEVSRMKLIVEFQRDKSHGDSRATIPMIDRPKREIVIYRIACFSFPIRLGAEPVGGRDRK